MTITTIEKFVYQTSDGHQFAYKSEALEHEFQKNLQAWATKHSLCIGGEWSQEMVLDSIRQDSMALAIMLAQRHSFEVVQSFSRESE